METRMQSQNNAKLGDALILDNTDLSSAMHYVPIHGSIRKRDTPTSKTNASFCPWGRALQLNACSPAECSYCIEWEIRQLLLFCIGKIC